MGVQWCPVLAPPPPPLDRLGLVVVQGLQGWPAPASHHWGWGWGQVWIGFGPLGISPPHILLLDNVLLQTDLIPLSVLLGLFVVVGG